MVTNFCWFCVVLSTELIRWAQAASGRANVRLCPASSLFFVTNFLSHFYLFDIQVGGVFVAHPLYLHF